MYIQNNAFACALCECVSADENKNLYVKWKSLGGKLKKLREQIIKSQSFAFAFDKVCASIYIMCVCYPYYGGCMNCAL